VADESNLASFWGAIDRIRERDKRHEREAYALVMDSLEFAIKRVGERRHLTAAELLVHLCDFAKERYGVLAFSVLESWGVRSTEDVGSIVYNLIGERILAEREEDSPLDFSCVFDLRSRLEDQYFESSSTAKRREPRAE